MKEIIKKAVFLLVVLSLMCGIALDTQAAGTVTYSGSARKFIFAPGSKYSPTDLFPDFKGLMPGESVTQKIHIKNDVSNHVKIKLYLRSLGAQKGSEDFLSQLRVTVSQDGNSNLFDAPANETAQLTEWTYLGTFYSGAEIDLNVTVQVPAEMGNEYQEAVGYLRWQFKAEELPISPDDPKPPQTGDNTNAILYVAIGSTAILAVVFLLLFKRKNYEQ